MSKPRFTDVPPPPDLLDEYPNWVHAPGEEGRRGQDETTIKPQRQQKRIDDDTQYTAIDVWLADGTEAVGLLGLDWGKPSRITVYDDGAVWRLWRSRLDPVWRPLGVAPVELLPLHYRSRLRYERKPLCGVIRPDGTWSDWTPEDE